MTLIHSILSVTFAVALTSAPCFTQTIRAYAGTSDGGFGGDGGPALTAQFSSPGSLAADGAGGLYIVDSNNFRIRWVTADGNIWTVAGTGDAASPVEGPASQSSFISVYDIAVDAYANLFIADADGLQIVDTSGNLSFVITGQSFPGIAISNQGAIYEGDITTVLRIENDGTSTQIAGTDIGDSGDGGPATAAEFFVTGLATDLLGNLYILDGESSRIRVFTDGGIISTLAGTGSGDFFGDGGPANQAALNQPSGIAVDVAGNVYVSDTLNFRIRKITTDGVIDTFAGQTTDTDNSGDDGPALQASFNYPGRLAVTCTSLYVVDNQRIRSIDLTDPLIAQDGISSIAPGNANLQTALAKSKSGARHLPVRKPSLSVSAGQSFSVSGCNLAAAAIVADPTLPLPTILGGAVVTVNGVLASIVSVSPTQIVALLPDGIDAGTATVSIWVNGAGTVSGTINVTENTTSKALRHPY